MLLTSLKPVADFKKIQAAIGSRKGIVLQNCRRNLLRLKDLLDSHHIPFLLAYGTLLGAVREKDFIAGDHDTDLVVMSELERALAYCLSSLPCEDAGFRICRANRGMVTLTRLGEYIDIYLFSPSGNGWRDCLGCYRIEEDQLAMPSEIEFLGTKWKTVARPIEFLEERYGDWKTPRQESTRI